VTNYKEMNLVHVEIFKTSIQDLELAEVVRREPLLAFPRVLVSFDLEDCDRILRIEGKDFCVERVVLALTCRGLLCELLE